MATSVKTQCPNIVPQEELLVGDEFNQVMTYPCSDGSTYIFYKHQPPIIGDPKDEINRPYNVQFCQKCGRKKDVFECLNENEWKKCIYNQIGGR